MNSPRGAVESSEDNLSCNAVAEKEDTELSLPSPPLSRIGLNDHKAGMKGLDKDKINQIILEATKGSKYYENEVKKEQQVTKRIDALLESLNKIRPSQELTSQQFMDKEAQKLEESRALDHIIVHVDMDAFYAAVEMRDNPKLKDVPMAVGSYSMLSTSNYPARRFGVRAAMPGFIAKKLCPDLVLVDVNFDKYKKVSRMVQSILVEYDPHFSPMGLDESYLDLTAYVKKTMSRSESNGLMVQDSKCGNEAADVKGGMVSVESACNHSICQNECLYTDSKEGLFFSSLSWRFSPSHWHTAPELPPSHWSTAPELPPSHWSTAPELPPSHWHTAPELPASHWHTTPELPPSHWSTAPELPPSHWNTAPELPPSHWSTAESVVKEIRSRVQSATGLTASAGIAPNMMLAKVASDLKKPNGQFLVTPTREGVLEFVQQLPIRKICGIGKVMERLLKAVGVTTCRHLYEERAKLNLLFSPLSSQHFLRISLGIGSSSVHSQHGYERKSISTERTFSEISSVEGLQSKCMELCQSLAKDMQHKGLKGRNVTLKLKKVNFEIKSRAETLSKPISTVEDLYDCASQLLKAEIQHCRPEPLRLRLMGVRVASLQQVNSESSAKQETLTQFFTISSAAGTPSEPSTQEELLHSAKTSTQEELLDSNRSSHTPPQINVQTGFDTCGSGMYGSGEETLSGVDETVSGADDSTRADTAVCPVCGGRVPADNVLFNRHIDECLSRTALWQAHEDTAQASRLFKRKVNCCSPATVKKRRRFDKDLVGSINKPRTLESFWK